MFNADGKLDIFESFRTDWELPKFKASEEDEQESSKSKVHFVNNSVRFTGETSDDSVNVSWNPRQSKQSWIKRLSTWWHQRKEPKPTMSVEVFFRSVKNSVEELKIVDERARGYQAAILRAKAYGQKALIEQMEQNLVAVRSETQLIAMGLGKYLEEATVVGFAKKATKGLRLDWAANFTRIIPDNLLALKTKADERRIFDNYVILHYDPNKKSWAETEAEKARRRDPILFGVISGRRRLYYIGDWVDEHCDLTLDQVADSMGKNTVLTLETAP